MPVYEYECAQCGGVTEALRKMADADTQLPCQNCASTHTTRRYSVFTAGGPREPAGYTPPRTDGPVCGHCGGLPGSCQA